MRLVTVPWGRRNMPAISLVVNPSRWNDITTMYREGWITKKVIDVPAEDMTKAWISFDTQIDQDAERRIEKEMRQYKVQKKITDGIKWARLYGGAIGVILVEGQEDMMDTQLELALVMPGTFRGILIVDRWSGVEPSMEVVDDLSDVDYGLPKYYTLTDAGNDGTLGNIRIHHSRVIRFVGRELPYQEEEAEKFWGASELEHIYDELNKRNATSSNIAQLVFQANLRVLKMGDLGEILALSDERTQRELYQTIQAQNMLMTSFGLQVLDRDDNFETHPYAFAGLNDIYQSFMADIAGASEIPATKLFGKAPDGMNSTGEGDLMNYYESIRQKQENLIRPGIEKLLPVVCVSALGKVPDDIEIAFEPVESSTTGQKAALAQQISGALSGLYQSDIITKAMALMELRKSAFVTGIGSTITDEDIENAENEASLPPEQDMPGMGGEMGMPGIEGKEQPLEAQGGGMTEGVVPGEGEQQEQDDAMSMMMEQRIAELAEGIERSGETIDGLLRSLYNRGRYTTDEFDPNRPREDNGQFAKMNGGGEGEKEPEPKKDASKPAPRKLTESEKGWVQAVKGAFKAKKPEAQLKNTAKSESNPNIRPEIKAEEKQAPKPEGTSELKIKPESQPGTNLEENPGQEPQKQLSKVIAPKKNPLDDRSEKERAEQLSKRGTKDENTSGLPDSELEERATGKRLCPNGFGSVGRMHHKLGKHLNEWKDLGVTTFEDVAKRGFKLASSEVGGDIDGYVRGNGTIVRYNKVTNEWIAFDPNKVIVNKPTTGYRNIGGLFLYI